MRYSSIYLTQMLSVATMSVAAQKRPVRVNVTLGANGVSTVALPAGLTAAPDIDPIVTLNAAGTILYVPRVTAVTATSITVAGAKTKGILLLSGSALEPCTTGDVVSLWLTEK